MIREEVEERGFATCSDVLSPMEVKELLMTLEHIRENPSVRNRDGIFGVRNLLDVSPEVRELAHSIAVPKLVEPVLGPDYFQVRGILSTKSRMQLESALAPGRHDRRTGQSRGRRIWTVVSEVRCSPCSTSGLCA